MNSEKVKEIKELLLRKAKEYESQTLLDILTLINELESENELLRNEKVVYETVDYCYEDLKKAEKRIAELEKENERLLDSVETVQNNRCVYKCELAKKQLKQFAERLKGKLQDFGDGGEKGAYITEKDIDETLKEFINGKERK